MTSEEKAPVREILFAHLRGIVVAPVVQALCDRGVFGRLKDSPAGVEIDEIAASTRANRGYLRVALRLLASMGWLSWQAGESGSVICALTAEGIFALGIAPDLYREVVSFIPMAIFLEDFLAGRSQGALLPRLQALVEKARGGWGIDAPRNSPMEQVRQEICLHLDGILTGPAMVALARNGTLDRLMEGPAEVDALTGNQACLASLLDLFESRGWMARNGQQLSLTHTGRYLAGIASSYGITVSYLPMLSVVSTLLFGNPRIPRADESGVELLVNRGLNVWSTGRAHATYFRRVDEILIDIFNRSLELQPLGICDMGCGDGSFLLHAYEVIRERTSRGQVMDEYPLLVVGADFNKVARRLAKRNLKNAHIPDHHVVHGDINRPGLLASDLEGLGVDIHDLLHMRSFLDHNRPYLKPSGYVRGSRPGRSTGAFAHLGEEIPVDELEENLVRHLRRWAPYVGRFGLLILELHTIPPETAAASLVQTSAPAYDGTHGFSDQYPVEAGIFLDCAREAGLHAEARFQRTFPASNLAMVSLNLFTAPQA